jgi:hypothetical protein
MKQALQLDGSGSAPGAGGVLEKKEAEIEHEEPPRAVAETGYRELDIHYSYSCVNQPGICEERSGCDTSVLDKALMIVALQIVKLRKKR